MSSQARYWNSSQLVLWDMQRREITSERNGTRYFRRSQCTVPPCNFTEKELPYLSSFLPLLFTFTFAFDFPCCLNLLPPVLGVGVQAARGNFNAFELCFSSKPRKVDQGGIQIEQREFSSYVFTPSHLVYFRLPHFAFWVVSGVSDYDPVKFIDTGFSFAKTQQIHTPQGLKCAKAEVTLFTLTLLQSKLLYLHIKYEWSCWNNSLVQLALWLDFSDQEAEIVCTTKCQVVR